MRLAQTARETPVTLFTSTEADPHRVAQLEECGVRVLREESGGRDLRAVLKSLAGDSLQGVLVEGGANVAGAFLRAGLVNKVSFFVAPIILGGDALSAVGGAGALTVEEAMKLNPVEIERHGRDVEITGYVGAGDK
jgi:diaminohydroxyphosphoribosylaminopyrimidine deaminase/5-amino-6-(5-phosphoribosylamino)uracil reductase